MAIKGLNARPEEMRIGKLRKGGEKGTNRPGPDLDHFRFTSDDPAAMAAFEAAYGKEAQDVLVELPYAAPGDNYSVYRELWKGRNLQHRCDGETCIVWRDEKGERQTDPIPCPGECKPVLRLRLLIPALYNADIFGWVVLETHSFNDIFAIEGTLAATAKRSPQHSLFGIQFTLRRVQESIRVPNPKKPGERMTVKKWLVKILVDPEWTKTIAAYRRELALDPERQERLLAMEDRQAARDNAVPSDDRRSAARNALGGRGEPFPGEGNTPGRPWSADDLGDDDGGDEYENWTDDPELVAKVKMVIKEGKFESQAQVFEALMSACPEDFEGGIDKISDFPGTFEEAIAALGVALEAQTESKDKPDLEDEIKF